MVNLITENVKKIFVVCIGKSEFFETLKAKVVETFKNIPIRFGEISPVMGTHVGPGGLGIACITY
jgi:fatty acid-binding protein DegV